MYKPRFWTDEEWGSKTSKERIWIWYKDFWYLMGEGNAEVDNLLFFIQGQFLTLYIAWIALVGIYHLPDWTLFAPFVYFVANKWIMWKIGDWKDKHDLIALQSEISNKRVIFVREMREQMSRQTFRKGLVQKKESV